MTDLFSTTPLSVSFPISNADEFASMRIEQRLTAVIAGKLTFTQEISSFIQTEFINNYTQITQKQNRIIHWHDTEFFILFSYPTPFEDDAQQCAQLAWQLHQFAQESPSITQNRFALVLNTTHVKKRPDAEFNHLVIEGDALEQAHQLLNENNDSGIFATDSFYSAAQHEFEFETAVSPDPNTLNWQLKNPRPIPQKARGFKTLSSGFIGREQPLKKMFAIAENLEKGSGGIIIIEGEPGIGKSRLMHEFCTAVHVKNKIVISGKCTPQRTHYPLSLFISLLANSFNIRSNDSTTTSRRKIEEQTQNWPSETQAFIPYLYILLGLNDKETQQGQLNMLDPNQTRQQIFVAVRRILKTFAQQNTVIILLDDLHWIDPLSAELLLFLATTIATDPIFIICTQRRQGADAPNDRLVKLQSLLVGQTEKLFLERLSPSDTTALLRNLLAGADLPKEFERLITTKSEGNPYFIEEFVRMFIEQGYIEKSEEGWHITHPDRLDTETFPLSLNTLLQARIAALPTELKPILQWAAILGFYFESALLEDILQNNAVTEDLERLSLRLMVQHHGDLDRWQFHHPLLQTAVYNSTPQKTRLNMHKQVANTLQTSQIEETPEIAERLAYHLTQANEQRDAIPYLIKAGQLAIQRHAGEEALNNFQKASDFSAQISAPKTIWYWEIILGMGDAYRFLGRFAESADVLETGLRMTETNQEFMGHRPKILRQLGDTHRKQGENKVAEDYYQSALELLQEPQTSADFNELSLIYFGRGWLYFRQAKLEDAQQACEKTLAYAQKTNHLGNLATAENLLGGIAYRLGDWQEAMRHTTRAMILREEMGDSGGITASLGNLGVLADEGGFWDKAITYFQNNLVLCEENGNIEGIVSIHNSLAKVYQNQGKLDIARTHHQKSLDTAELFNMPFHIANAAVELAFVLTLESKYIEAFKVLKNGKQVAFSIKAKGLLIELATVEAEWLLAQARYGEAAKIAEKTLEEAQEIGNKIEEVHCWRLIAETSIYKGSSDRALFAITQAQNLIANSTYTLEKGKTAALAYLIYIKVGEKDNAQTMFAEAETIFKKLGASLSLKKLYLSQKNNEFIKE